jgi:hypothetical protein
MATTSISEADLLKILTNIADKKVDGENPKATIYLQGFWHANFNTEPGNYTAYTYSYELNKNSTVDKARFTDTQVEIICYIMAANAGMYTNIFNYPRVLFVPLPQLPGKLEPKFTFDYDRIILVGNTSFMVCDRVMKIGSTQVEFKRKLFNLERKGTAILRDFNNDVDDNLPLILQFSKDKNGNLHPVTGKIIYNIPEVKTLSTTDLMLNYIIKYAINRSTRIVNTDLDTKISKDALPDNFASAFFKLGLNPFVIPYDKTQKNVHATLPLIDETRIKKLIIQLSNNEKPKGTMSKIKGEITEETILSVKNEYKGLDPELSNNIEKMLLENYIDSDSSDVEKEMEVDSDFLSASQNESGSENENSD